jgi:hypothetical protein
MTRGSKLILFFALTSGFISSVKAQNSAHIAATANVTILPAQDPQTLRINHAPFFGIEQSGSQKKVHTGNGMKISTNFSQEGTAILAKGEPGYEVNVSVGLTGDIIASDGSGNRLRGSVVESDKKEVYGETFAQRSGYSGEMRFSIAAMAPDASAVKNGTYEGAFNVIITYN